MHANVLGQRFVSLNNCLFIYVIQICPYFRNKQKHTPLDVAAMQGHDNLVKLLIRTISDSNPKDTIESLINPTVKFDSPLHLAVVQRHQAAVETLIKEHAKITLENYLTKKTPLQVAIEKENE